MQKINISWEFDSLEITIGSKSFRGSDGMDVITEAVADAFRETGYEVEVEAVY